MSDTATVERKASAEVGRIEKIKLVLQLISTTSIVLAAIGVWVAYKAYTAQHEWNRRMYTLELLRNYDRDAKHHSDKLIYYFRGLLYRSQTKSLSEEEAKDIYYLPNPELGTEEKPAPNNGKAQKTNALTPEQRRERREHVIAFLNYMEFVCKAYEARMVDQQMIYESFSAFFIRRFTYFESIIKLSQMEQSSKDSWAPIVRVVGEWRRRDEEAARNMPATGMP